MGQCLVMAHDKSRTLHLFDDVRHGERLSRSRHTKKCNGINALFQGFAYALYRRGLVARRLIFAVYLEFHITNIAIMIHYSFRNFIIFA